MWGFVFFAALFLAGDYLSTRFALPIPGSIIGLGFALGFFAVRGKVDAQFKPAADLLLRYLPLLLVPIGAGVIRIVDSPPPGLWRLEVVLIIALLVGVLGTAKIAQGLLALGSSSAGESSSAAAPGATHAQERKE
jgi:holin-like protein